MWEAAGRQYGRAFDFWLEAEKQTLAALTRTAATPPLPPDDVVAAAHEKQRERQAAIADKQKKKQDHKPEEEDANSALSKQPAKLTKAPAVSKRATRR
jgi:hypothetical protein